MDDKVQLARAIRLLLTRVGSESLWTDDGPTIAAKWELREIPTWSLPLLSKQLFLRVAFELWAAQEGRYPVVMMSLRSLSSENLEAVLGLVLAIRKGTVAHWMAGEKAIQMRPVGSE